MSTKRMLIDAAHPEETRVVVLDGNRVDDFDYELANRRQLRGNIYLAKVTRVEPSLQAAFVEYGGNRHGFLAFSEIHPDYYQIPTADREALKAEEAAARSQDDADEDDDESPGARNHVALRRYKVQEVIRRRQILLVQVVKEERGNKGAALTTYLSLAGRYCVLMPNTDRGGGISRKITNATDRKRLKKVASELEVAPGMGLIIRTAGAKRTKTEIKRDYEYLTRAWDDIRDRTLSSVAPALIYEESSLVKRAIRDLYDKDVDSILVDGDDAYREAKDFVKMLMPSHSKKVQQYKEPQPLFARHKVDGQLESIYSPVVQLKSGGYIVINQTEALVAIDVNSGRSTRERSIESTALKTNLEAADEAARQMRLRDLAGLVVIDFIDMEESKNDRAVEKRMKDALRFDRARVQMGKISSFGLLEISRQRRRTGILEGTSVPCPHCEGTGRIRSVEAASLLIVRGLEEAAERSRAGLEVRACTPVALYLLNEKRDFLQAIEQRRGIPIRVSAASDISQGNFEILQMSMAEDAEPGDEAPRAAAEPLRDRETSGSRTGRNQGRRRPGRRDDEGADTPEAADVEPVEIEEDEVEVDAAEAGADADSESAEDRKGGRRRRRGRRGGRRRGEDGAVEGSGAPEATTANADTAEGDGNGRRRRRRRGRGGRPGFDGGEHFDFLSVAPLEVEGAPALEAGEEPVASDTGAAASLEGADAIAGDPASADEATPAPRPRRRRRGNDDAAPVQPAQVTPAEITVAPTPEPDAEPVRGPLGAALPAASEIVVERAVVVPRPAADPAPTAVDAGTVGTAEPARTIVVPDVAIASEPTLEGSDDTEPKPRRRGWWGGFG